MNKINNEKEYSKNHTEQLYNRFLNLALNRFSWDNLPNGITSRKIEEMLIKNGQVMFTKDEELGVYICLKCNGTGIFDMYNEPLKYQLFGSNGYNKIVDRDEGVVIRNNACCTNDSSDLMLFAERINEIEQTMDINLNGQKTPYIILCDEKERLTFKNILKQVNTYKYAIFGSKKLNIKDNIILNTKSEYLLDKLQNQKMEVVNELLTFLGINNNNTNKRERLLVDEVNANNDFILVNLDHMYDERKLACDLINEKFGLKITVSKRNVQLGGIDNGELYGRTENDSEGL